MAKRKEQPRDPQARPFPADVEIVKCAEGNKEFLKERPARKPYGRMVKICEYGLDAVSEFDSEDARIYWKLAKRAARDFLRNSWIKAAIVTATKTDRVGRSIIIYGKY